MGNQTRASLSVAGRSNEFSLEIAGGIVKTTGKPSITQRVRDIGSKIEKAGLVDISVGWSDADWAPRNIGGLIARLAPNSDLYMVGRTFMAWSMYAKSFAEAVASKSIRCRMVIANPKLQTKRLVADDQAQRELPTVFGTFERRLPVGFSQASHAAKSRGFIELYGIPAFIPETFMAGTLDDGTRYCCLEIGIAVDPTQRTQLFFQHVGRGDVYSSLCRVYENILAHDPKHEVAELLLRVDAQSVARSNRVRPRARQLGRSKLIRYFISYAHHDTEWKDKLCVALAHRLASVEGYRFEAWDDQELLPGEDWHERIGKAVAGCDFGLLLLSPAFLASQYVKDIELPAFIHGDSFDSGRNRRAIPVALYSLPQRMSLKGLERTQIFYFKDARARQKAFFDCTGRHREAFVDHLFDQIVKVVKGTQ
jgi:hypothetical protein